MDHVAIMNNKFGDLIPKILSGLVLAKAGVERVVGIENLDQKAVRWIAREYGLKEEWGKDKKYCTLIFLKNPKKVSPFKINKSGFGSAAAWLCYSNSFVSLGSDRVWVWESFWPI